MSDYIYDFKEEEEEIKVTRVNLKCPKCDKGNMHYQMSQPRRDHHLHQCDNCNNKNWVKYRIYPTIKE